VSTIRPYIVSTFEGTYFDELHAKGQIPLPSFFKGAPRTGEAEVSTIRPYIVSTFEGTGPTLVRRAVFAYDARDALVQANHSLRRGVHALSPPLTDDDWAVVRNAAISIGYKLPEP
jgi:hypothetical protein